MLHWRPWLFDFLMVQNVHRSSSPGQTRTVYFHFKHNCFTILECQTLWTLPCWALNFFFFTPIIFLSSVLGWVSDMRAVWSFGVLLFNDLLGTSGALLSAGLITPHYWGKTCLLVLPIPYELWVFQSGWTEQGLFPGLCECWALSFSPSSPHLPPWASPSPLYSLPHHPSLQ